MFRLETSTIVSVGVVSIVVVVAVYVLRGKFKNGSLNKKGNTKSVKSDDHSLYPAGPMNIYFGSQTGTAENFARILEKEGKKKGFLTKVCDLEDFDPLLLTQPSLSLFLMATYGEGEPTDNAGKFYKYLKNEDSSLLPNTLSNLSFTVFGLGNKQYEHFNRMGKTTNAYLENLGGNRIFEYGEGDDNECIEDDFQAWRNKMWTALVSKYHPDAKSQSSIDMPKNDNIVDEDERNVELTYQVKYLDTGRPVSIPANIFANHQIASSTRHFFTAPEVKVIAHRELRSGDSKLNGSTRHIELSLEGSGLTYHTADNLAVLPENDLKTVQLFANTLGFDLKQLFTIEAIGDNTKNFKYPFPTPCTIETVFMKYYDLTSVPRINILQSLLPYVMNPSQRQWLIDILSPIDKHIAYKIQIESTCRSIADVIIHSLPSLNIQLADLLHILPHMQPRYYTISSSSNCYPNSIHITVSIHEFQNKDGKIFKGLCSSFLQSLYTTTNSMVNNNAKLCRVFVRASSFRLPQSLSTPIVMIGPGTGIAPMRALLQEIQLQSESQKIGGVNILYFGCRNRDIDFIYKDELEAYRSKGVLSELHVAFSREGNKKVYVQDLLQHTDNALAILTLLVEKGAYFYICGGSTMGTDVHKALLHVLETHGRMKSNEALAYVEGMQKTGRYVQELWSA